MIYKRRKAGTSKILVTFELPVELRELQCSLVGDFNEWDPSADIFSPANNFRVLKEFEYGSTHEFLYLTKTGEYFQDPQSDGICQSSIGTINSIVVSRVSERAPMSILGLNLSFIQEQLIGILLLLVGFVATLYIFGIYMALHGVSFVKLLQLPLNPNFIEEATRIIQGAGNFDFVSFQQTQSAPTLFALFLETYVWCALGVLANQVYEIYDDIAAPGPVLTLSHVASWLRAIIARPPIAAVIILFLQALDITIGGYRLSSIGMVISIAFLAGFSGSFSDDLVLALIARIKQAVKRSHDQKETGLTD